MERKSDHATANRIYDDFEPISNWKTEQGFVTLTVSLPGFRKEQLKVQVTTTRKLRVMGERPTGPNKWIRFRKEFPIRSNIDVDSIAAKFEGTNLVIKLHTPEPVGKQTLHSGTTTKPPTVPKETKKVQSSSKPTREHEAELKKQTELQKPIREEDAKEVGKEEAMRVGEKKKDNCDGILNQDYRYKVNAYKENLGGYLALMKNNKTAITAGMIAPAAAVLLLSLGFFAGRMFTSYN